MSFNNNIVFNKFVENIGNVVEKTNNKYNIYDTNHLNISAKIDFINDKNIILYVFIFVSIFSIMNLYKITLNHIFSLSIFLIIFMYLMNHDLNTQKNYYNQKKKEISFLNEYLFNNQQKINYNLYSKLYDNKELSYFYLDPFLSDLLYNLKELVNYNSYNYGRILLHCNNILAIKNDVSLGLEDIGQNYQNTIMEKQNALNALESCLLSIENSAVFNQKIRSALDLLHSILNKHLNDILTHSRIHIVKNSYNIHTKPIDLLKSESIINPHNTKDNLNEFFNV